MLRNAEPNCLIVSCHPLKDSLCHHLVGRVEAGLEVNGVACRYLDLYERGFGAALTAAERASYFGEFDGSGIGAETAQLKRAETLILVFPAWLFGMPALLKGCAPQASFEMLSLYGVAALDAARLEAFGRKIDRAVMQIR